MSDEIQVSPEEPDRTRVSRRKFLGGVAGAGSVVSRSQAFWRPAARTTTRKAAARARNRPRPRRPARPPRTRAQPIVIGSAYPTGQRRD